jgi:hypothetical protein
LIKSNMIVLRIWVRSFLRVHAKKTFSFACLVMFAKHQRGAPLCNEFTPDLTAA